MELTKQNYATLSVQERLNRSLAAIAKNDGAELEKLRDTCPSYTYAVSDLDYSLSFQALIFLALHFSQVCITAYFTAQLHNSCLVGAAIAAPEYQTTPEVIETAKKGMQENMLFLSAHYQGFYQFCEQLGVNFNDMLAIAALSEKCPKLKNLLVTDVALSNIENAKEEYLLLYNKYRGVLNIYH